MLDLREPTSQGREGQETGRKGREGEEGEREGGKGEEGEGKLGTPQFLGQSYAPGRTRLLTARNVGG